MFVGGTGLVFLGAGLVLAGVVAGALITILCTKFSTQPRRGIIGAAEARQVALRTVIALDDFVGACHAAVNDMPEFNPADPSEFLFHVEDPRLNLPRDVDWIVLDQDLGEQLQWMPNRIRNVMDGLDSLDGPSLALEVLFERREEDFARLGLRALDLMAAISARYDCGLPQRPTHFDPRQHFLDRIAAVAESRGRRLAATRRGNEVSNVTYLTSQSRKAATAAVDTDPKT